MGHIGTQWPNRESLTQIGKHLPEIKALSISSLEGKGLTLDDFEPWKWASMKTVGSQIEKHWIKVEDIDSRYKDIQPGRSTHNGGRKTMSI
jgi:hypothetical protein